MFGKEITKASKVNLEQLVFLCPIELVIGTFYSLEEFVDGIGLDK